MNSESNNSDNDINILMNKLNQKLSIHEESRKFKSYHTKKSPTSQNNQNFVKNDSTTQFDTPVSNLSNFIKSQLKETRSTEEIRSNGFILPKLLMPNHSNTNVSQDTQNFQIPLLERFRLQNDQKTKQLCNEMKNLQIDKEQKEELVIKRPLIDLTTAINYNVNKAEAIAISLKCKQDRLRAIEARNTKIETFDIIQNIKDTYRTVQHISYSTNCGSNFKFLKNASPLARFFSSRDHLKLKHSQRNKSNTPEAPLHTIERFTFNAPSPDDIVLERIRKIRSSYMHK